MELTDQVAVVTGGAQGIGYAIAERLSRAGACVVIAEKDEDKGLEAAERLQAGEGKAVAVQTDVTLSEEAEAMVERTLEAFDQLDILVNNAGTTGQEAPLWELADKDWEDVLRLNLTSTFYCCRAAIGHMRERKSGSIVNMASISGKEGNPSMIPYSASKAGVICLTKALAKEVINDGIRVNSVAPGVVETPLLSQLDSETVDYMRSNVPMGRLGHPEEVAAVVHFLASDDASFVTGQCYDASGGRATY